MKTHFLNFPYASVRSMRIGAPGRKHAVKNIELVWVNVKRRLMLIRFIVPGGTIDLQLRMSAATLLGEWILDETTVGPFIIDEQKKEYIVRKKRKIARQRAKLESTAG